MKIDWPTVSQPAKSIGLPFLNQQLAYGFSTSNWPTVSQPAIGLPFLNQQLAYRFSTSNWPTVSQPAIVRQRLRTRFDKC